MAKIQVQIQGDILELNRFYSFLELHAKKITAPTTTSLKTCEQLTFEIQV